MGEQQQPDIIDENIDRILRAAGSGLRYYMPSTKDKLRNVMAEIEAEHRATIAALVGALEHIAAIEPVVDQRTGYVDDSAQQTAIHALQLARGSKGNG